eukprot:scaffold114758_cov51-Phaeocystis_antarctica.AAC.1
MAERERGGGVEPRGYAAGGGEERLRCEPRRCEERGGAAEQHARAQQHTGEEQQAPQPAQPPSSLLRRGLGLGLGLGL